MTATYVCACVCAELAAPTGRRLLGLAAASDIQSHHLLRHLLQSSNSSGNSSTTNGTLPSVLPGERLVVTSTGLSSAGNTNITGASAASRISQIEEDAMGTNETNPYKRLLRVLFWLAVLLAVVLVLHLIILAAFMYSRWNTPSLLHFPRPELMVLLISLAAIAQGAASECCPDALKMLLDTPGCVLSSCPCVRDET